MPASLQHKLTLPAFMGEAVTHNKKVPCVLCRCFTEEELDAIHKEHCCHVLSKCARMALVQLAGIPAQLVR